MVNAPGFEIRPKFPDLTTNLEQRRPRILGWALEKR
jgi:hypothetical protein